MVKKECDHVIDWDKNHCSDILRRPPLVVPTSCETYIIVEDSLS